MKCLYFKVCKEANENSTICCDDGGGSHCGHYRNLLRIENRNIKKKKEVKNMKKIDFWLLGEIILIVLVLLSIIFMFIAESGTVVINILTFWAIMFVVMLIIYLILVKKNKNQKKTSFI